MARALRFGVIDRADVPDKEKWENVDGVAREQRARPSHRTCTQ